MNETLRDNTLFAVAHYASAIRAKDEIKPTFHTNDHAAARAKFDEWCKAGGPEGSGIFFFDFHLFGGGISKHVFGKAA